MGRPLEWEVFEKENVNTGNGVRWSSAGTTGTTGTTLEPLLRCPLELSL